ERSAGPGSGQLRQVRRRQREALEPLDDLGGPERAGADADRARRAERIAGLGVQVVGLLRGRRTELARDRLGGVRALVGTGAAARERRLAGVAQRVVLVAAAERGDEVALGLQRLARLAAVGRAQRLDLAVLHAGAQDVAGLDVLDRLVRRRALA